MFVKFFLSTLFIALVISGQTPNPDPGQGSAGACAGALLGIIADEHYAVVDIVEQSPADATELQVGDVLLDLTLLEIGAPWTCYDTGTPPSGAVPAPRDPSFYPTEPVEFSDQEAIRTLTDYNLTLRLRVLRAGETVEFEIQPGHAHHPLAPGAPTPTAIPATPTFYFY